MKYEQFVEYLQSRRFEEKVIPMKNIDIAINKKVELYVNGNKYPLAEGYTLVHLCKVLGFPASFFEPFVSTVGKETAEKILQKFKEKREKDKVYVQIVNGAVRAIRTKKFAPIKDDEVISICEKTLKNLKPYQYVYQWAGVDQWSYVLKDVVDIYKGDKLYGGIRITNSEIGHRKLYAEAFLFREICSNGATETFISREIFSRVHIGSNEMILKAFEAKIVQLASSLPKILKLVQINATKRIKDMNAALNNLSNVFGVSEKIIKLIEEAYREEPINEDVYSLAGAISRVASHNTQLSDGVKSKLSELAGNILTNSAFANAVVAMT
ncbi:MAG: hypothetical protein ACTSPL_04060 [Candidatus Odinarchaeia archaeon]